MFELWLLFVSLSGRGQHRAVNARRVLSNLGFLIELKTLNVTGTKVGLWLLTKKEPDHLNQASCFKR